MWYNFNARTFPVSENSKARMELFGFLNANNKEWGHKARRLWKDCWSEIDKKFYVALSIELKPWFLKLRSSLNLLWNDSGEGTFLFTGVGKRKAIRKFCMQRERRIGKVWTRKPNDTQQEVEVHWKFNFHNFRQSCKFVRSHSVQENSLRTSDIARLIPPFTALAASAGFESHRVFSPSHSFMTFSGAFMTLEWTWDDKDLNSIIRTFLAKFKTFSPSLSSPRKPSH